MSRDLKGVLEKQRRAVPDAQMGFYIQPAGPALHRVTLDPQGIPVLARGSYAWAPGEPVTLVRPQGERFWVIVSAPPPGQAGAGAVPIAANTSAVIVPTGPLHIWGVWHDGSTLFFDRYNLATGEFLNTQAAIDEPYAPTGMFKRRGPDYDVQVAYIGTDGADQYIVHVNIFTGERQTWEVGMVPSAPIIRESPVADVEWVYWTEFPRQDWTESPADPNPLELWRAPTTDLSQAEMIDEKTDIVDNETTYLGLAYDFFYAYTQIIRVESSGPTRYAQDQVGLPLEPDFLLSQDNCTMATIVPGSADNYNWFGNPLVPAVMTSASYSGAGGGLSQGLGLWDGLFTLGPKPAVFYPGCTLGGVRGYIRRSPEVVVNGNIDLNQARNWALFYDGASTGTGWIGTSQDEFNYQNATISLLGNPLASPVYPTWAFFGESEWQQWPEV